MRSKPHTKTALAVALALSALAAPSAYALADRTSPVVVPNPDQQTANVGRSASTPPSQATTVVRPNPDQQAAATSANNQGISTSPVSCGDVCSGHGYGPVSSAAPIVRVSSPNNGFDWGDAGIGAAGGIGLSILGLAGTVGLSQRRTRRSSRSAAAIS